MGISPTTRRARLSALTGLASLAIAAAGLVGAAPAQAQNTAATAGSGISNEFNPYSSKLTHSTLPGLQQYEAMKRTRLANQPHAAATGQETLSYGGGVDGIGVQSGHSKVYLVFYGSQWGTQTTDANGNAKFSGDSAGAAGATQQMFKGIGTNNERWSADLTQWCDGPNVAAGAVSCPSNANFIPYQAGGVLSGVWYDNAGASPAQASGNQLGVEAVNAAAHFGNTTAASNRDAYYVVLSPHGTNPDDYQNPSTGYCAWHDWNGDTTLTGGAAASPYGDIAFSNQPYNIDQGANCGVGFVNSPGTLDGYTMTLGHEWHEMMSDQNPAGGWTNHVSGSTYNGQENSDECAWLKPGTAGGAANISFGSFGTYAEQASWSNDTNSCAITHAIVGGTTGNTVTVTNPGSKNATVGTAFSLQLAGTDSASGQTLTYSATGLPAGLSISASGLITGTPTTAGTSSVTVTATDTTGAKGTATFSLIVSTTVTGGGVVNGGFETGNLSSWTATGVTAASTSAAHTGSYGAMLGSANPSTTSSIAQTFTAPTGSTKVSFSYNVTCNDTVTYDWATATLKDNTTGTTTTVLAKTCTLGNGWQSASGALTAGHSYTLTLTNVDDNYPGDPTYTYYDDVTVS